MDILEFNRRQLLKGSGKLLTLAALSHLNAEDKSEKPNYIIPAKAKRVIYICHSGGQSQLDLFDHKPGLKKWHGKDTRAKCQGEYVWYGDHLGSHDGGGRKSSAK